MSLVRTTARLNETLVTAAQPFVSSRGELCAWVDVGDHGELGLYGSPESLRRMAAALVVAADAAEALPGESGMGRSSGTDDSAAAGVRS
jgi:hypothetical protein